MEELRGWSIAVCFAAVGCAAMQWIIPKEKGGKIYHLLVTTFFICSMIAPLLTFTVDLSLNMEWLPEASVSEELNDIVTEQLTRQVEGRVKEIAEECLSYRAVTAKEITVKTDISENGNIYIQQVVIYVDKQKVAGALAVRDVLEEQLGTTVSIRSDG